MRATEMLAPIDTLEIGLIEAQLFINANQHLIRESAYDNAEYRQIINTEKLYTNSPKTLISAQQYSPVRMLGIPVGKYINIMSSLQELSFVKEYDNRLWFRTSGMRDIILPAVDASTGNQCTDIIIFNNTFERDQFLSVLKLKFADWHFKITNI